MIRPNERIEHVNFPVDCLGSVVAITPEGRRIEVGIFGRDGMSSTSVLLGSDRSPHESFVQVAGAALRIGRQQRGSARQRATTCARPKEHRDRRALPP